MLILVRNLKLPVTAGEEEILAVAVKKVRAAGGKVLDASLNKRSVDARSKPIRFVCSVAVQTENPMGEGALRKLDACAIEEAALSLSFGKGDMQGRPIVVGFGPCGMFAALLLAENGYRPIVIERGDDIAGRVAATERFFTTRRLDTDSNVQFGAGGAGTFSDGKCVTRINDPLCRYVLERLREFGAPKSLLTLAKPHIGTDRLRVLVQNVADHIARCGGEIHYRTKLTGFSEKNGRITAITTNRGEVECGTLVLAIGHSARDTYRMLFEQGFSMQPKDFSVGVRIEHLQEAIDRAMYGENVDISRIGHAEYTLSHREGKRGVYTFCMCPGGQVMAAASEEGGVVTNGMSYFARDGKNANSAVAVSVLKEDYGSDPMAAIAFQREIERKAYTAGGGNYDAPMQTVGDFLTGKTGSTPTVVQPSYLNGGVIPSDLRTVLPGFVSGLLETGLRIFERQIKGFADQEAILTGVETRTSAPLRILRGDALTAEGYTNVYPGGEGAGYAGGITSAALDGVRIAAAIMKKYAQPENG